jgi:signal transduction protein with GAF and PtsI domain
VLSLSNEPQKLLNMALDTLAQVLEIECCWVQTINAGKRSLHLAAERGFTSDMQTEMSAMDIRHGFTRQVVGLGDEIVIPNLSSDGLYGLSSFRSAGYKWMVAAPLMTYRVNGVLGIASRNKKRLHKETADLVMVIAGLIGTALNKASLSHQSAELEGAAPLPDKDAPESPAVAPPEKQPVDDISPAPHRQPEAEHVKPMEGAFHSHAHRMKSFRDLHH